MQRSPLDEATSLASSSQEQSPVNEPTHPNGLRSSSRGRNWPAWIAGGTCLVVGFSAGMAIGSSGPQQASGASAAPLQTSAEDGSQISVALSQCEIEESDSGVYLMDSGSSLSMNATETGIGSVGVEEVVCVLTELEAPQSVLARMSRTRALDGTQTATWDEYEASWTYHPDNGLDMIIEGGSDA